MRAAASRCRAAATSPPLPAPCDRPARPSGSATATGGSANERPDHKEKHQGARREDLRAGAPQGHPGPRRSTPVFVGADGIRQGRLALHLANFVVSRIRRWRATRKVLHPAQLHEQEGQAAGNADITRRRRRGGNGAGAVGNSRGRGGRRKRDASATQNGAYYVRNGYVAAPGMMPSYAQQSHM